MKRKAALQQIQSSICTPRLQLSQIHHDSDGVSVLVCGIQVSTAKSGLAVKEVDRGHGGCFHPPGRARPGADWVKPRQRYPLTELAGPNQNQVGVAVDHL